MNAETAEKDKNQTEQAQDETKAPEASAENQANKSETESSKTSDTFILFFELMVLEIMCLFFFI